MKYPPSSAKAEDQGDFRNGMPFLGGSLWIDLLNSSFAPNGVLVDFLSDEAALADWARAAGLAFDGRPASGELEALRTLRDCLACAFDQLSRGEVLSEGVLDAVNAFLGGLSIHLRISNARDAPALEKAEHIEGPTLAVRIAADFARFITHFEASRLKHCESPACTMLFYDRGKNARRRWCSTAVCGNRDKVANYRARRLENS